MKAYCNSSIGWIIEDLLVECFDPQPQEAGGRFQLIVTEGPCQTNYYQQTFCIETGIET